MVYIQIIDARNGIYNSACINEQVKECMEIDNACRHFGFTEQAVDWHINPNYAMRTGHIRETSKLVTIVKI